MNDLLLSTNEMNVLSNGGSRLTKGAALIKQLLPWLLLVVTLMVMLSWLAYKSAGRNLGAEHALQSQLSELKETDAFLDVGIYDVRSNLDADYDLLAGTYEALLSQTKAIQAKSKAMGLKNDAMTKLIEQAEIKGDLLDKFKAGHALYRNSLKYLPDSVRHVRELAVAKHAPKQVDDLARSILALSLDYSITGNADKADELRTVAASLSSIDGLDEELDEARRELVAHAYSVVFQKSAETQQFSDFAAIQFRAQVNDIANDFQQQFDMKTRLEQLYRQALIAFSAVLLVVLVFLAFRLLQSFRLINDANANLEKNVAKRTIDLNQALQQLQTQQSQIIQQEKMASLGQMVAGVAHEINTPLGYLSSGLQSAQTSVPLFAQLSAAVSQMITTLTSENASQEEVERDISIAHSLATIIQEEGIVDEIDQLLKNGLFGVEQISEIVANLKDFSRLDSKSSVLYNTTDCIESTLKIATNVIKKVTIQKQLSEVPQSEGFPSQINQVLLNLITNACHATDNRDNGIVSITQTFDEQAKAIKIDIADNGTGIPRDIVGKIFDPFFTTKKVGQGTGLGLHISRQIIEAHKGKISVSSIEGKGTTFSIFLPVV
jgi:signal transduction histidine kinase